VDAAGVDVALGESERLELELELGVGCGLQNVQGLEGDGVWLAVGRRMVHEDEGMGVRRSSLKRTRKFMGNKNVYHNNVTNSIHFNFHKHFIVL
jgi:hypothetical protein